MTGKLTVRVDPQAALEWSDTQVAQRWLSAFPGSLSNPDDPDAVERAVLALIGDRKRLSELRARLGSLSWFMRALNEPIARRANREDHCTGRFWEGRFKCQALLDEQAVLSCMAYVDLNPVRAGLCEQLEKSDHTSVQRRLSASRSQKGCIDAAKKLLNQSIKPVAGLSVDELLDITESSYIELVQWTGEQARTDKRGKLRSAEGQISVPDALWSVASHPKQWLRQVQGTESRYYRAIGSAEALMLKAANMGQKWMKGISDARLLNLIRQQQTT